MMVLRHFAWSGLVLALLLAGGVRSASAYVGDQTCKVCHSDKYDAYKQHGHPWMLVHTAGQEPPADLFPSGVPLPPLPEGVTWDQIEYIYGGFHGGHGGFVFSTGFLDAAQTRRYTCGGCHTTGYNPSGTQLNHLGEPMTGANGSWALDGIQCEACHGENGPADHTWTGGTGAGAKVCDDCHVRTPGDFRMQYNTGDISGRPAGTFYDRQGEALRHSPHKNLECAACHSPHKTVWFQGEHEPGGIRFAEVFGKGDMCKQCHTNKRIRGAMGEEPFELECVECHMPYVSVNGGGAAHLFRISTDPTLTKDNNTVVDTDGKLVWKGTEVPGADAVLTLDLVCARCHSNMTLDQMAAAARQIHRGPGMVDLTVNLADDLRIVSKNQEVSVDVSVEAGDKAGKPADWWIVANTSWGWYYWNPKLGWKPGLYPSLKRYPVTDVPSYNLLKGKLYPGWYSFWFGIFPDDKSVHLDNVPLYVTP